MLGFEEFSVVEVVRAVDFFIFIEKGIFEGCLLINLDFHVVERIKVFWWNGGNVNWVNCVQ